MKRFLSLGICLVMIICLASCVKEDPAAKYIGTWKATKGDINGVQFDIGISIEGGAELEIKEDGAATLSMIGESISLSYDITDEGLNLKGDFTKQGVSEHTVTIEEDGTLVLHNFESASGMNVIFEKAQ